MFEYVAFNRIKPSLVSHMGSIGNTPRLNTSQGSGSNYPAVINHNYKLVTTPSIYIMHLSTFCFFSFWAAHRERGSEREEEIAGREGGRGRLLLLSRSS